ncbi:MAG: hypothetical protein OHK0046_14590 [Anaerolineae bacterium]
MNAVQRRAFGLLLLIGIAVFLPGAASGQEGTLIPIPPNAALFPQEAQQEAAVRVLQPRQEALTPLPDGTYAVIVRVRPQAGAFLPEGRFESTAQIQQQRLSIQTAQDTVLQRLSDSGAQVTNLHQYTTIPYLALHVDAAGLQALRTNPNVLSIVQDDVVEPQTYYANPVIGAPEVWAEGLTGEGYAVAIIDTGVDRTHPVFSGGKVIREACYNTDTTFTDSRCPGGVEELVGPGAAAPADCTSCEHGTHVAGIAAGNGDDVQDIYNTGEPTPFRGVAPDATIIAVNAFSLNLSNNRPTGFDSDIVAGLEFVYRLAVDGPDGVPNNGDEIDIAAANLSLGGEVFSDVCDTEDDDGFITIADQLASQNIAAVAASGNQANKNGIAEPACYSNFISVGATTIEASDPTVLAGDDGTVAYFSNSDSFLDLLAPGYFIISSVPAGEGTFGELDNYRRLKGTSMASPYVAGTWAIMRERFPEGSVDDILEQLKLTGAPVTDNGQATQEGTSPGNGLTTSLIQLPAAIDLREPVLLGPFTPTVEVRPQFFWEDQPLTQVYDIAVYNADTDEVVLVGNNVACSGEDICGVQASVSLVNNQAYYWTVQGKTNQGVVSPVARAGFVVRSASPQGEVITDTPDFVFARPSNPNITRYNLQVIDRDSNNNLLLDGDYRVADVCDLSTCVINPQVNLAQVIGNKRLAWRTREFNQTTGTYGDWSAYRDFTVLAPVVIAPSGMVTTGYPTYTVNKLSDGDNAADWYRFYVLNRDTDTFVYDTWVPVDEANCTATTCNLTPDVLLYNGSYVVYVNAYTNGLGRSAWSAGREFTVNAAPPNISTVALRGLYQSRLEGVTSTVNIPCEPQSTTEPVCITARPTLEVQYNLGGFSGEWTEIVLFDRDSVEIVYQEWVNRLTEDLDNVMCQDDTCFFQAPDLLENGRYAWYIRTWGAGGASVGGVVGYTSPGSTGDPDDLAEFQVGLPGAPITTLSSTLSAESDVTFGVTPVIVAGEVTFTWEAQPTALWYQLEIEDANNELIHEKWYEAGVDVNCDALLVCSLVPSDVFFTNGTYDWRVRYWNGVISQPSAVQSFTLSLPKPVLSQVAEMEVFLNETINGNTRPRYQWTPMANATWYELTVRRSGETDTVVNEWFRALNICDSAGCTAWPNVNLEAGSYQWTVRPWGPAGLIESGNDRIGPAAFTLSGTALGRPEPLTPVDITLAETTPVFTWRPAANASWYEIVITDENTDTIVFDQWFYVPEATCTGEFNGEPYCLVNPGVELPNGNYSWRLRPYGAPGIGDFANIFGISSFNFGISAPLSGVPALLSPIDDTPTPELVFVWERVNATWYQVEVKNRAGDVVFEEWNPVEDLQCDLTTCRLTVPNDEIPSGIYTWTVATWRPANGLNSLPRTTPETFIRL